MKRVCLFGPESTGKTTLGRALALHYGAELIPEYGRTYAEAHGQGFTARDAMKIVEGHLAGVALAMRSGAPVVIEDTDPVLTAIWCDVLLGARDPWFDQFSDTADLYLLTGIDVPFEPDAIRFFPDEAARRDFHDRCRRELERRGLPYVEVTGSKLQRLSTAIEAIDARLLAPHAPDPIRR